MGQIGWFQAQIVVDFNVHRSRPLACPPPTPASPTDRYLFLLFSPLHLSFSVSLPSCLLAGWRRVVERRRLDLNLITIPIIP